MVECLTRLRTFVLAGTDTTSSALARVLHLLAQHQDVQERLRQEITEARSGQDLSYDDLVNLPYLDAVCRETFRLYVVSPMHIITHFTIISLQAHARRFYRSRVSHDLVL